MDPLLKENLITTKDASELSGYTSDYLARLVRSGEITGKKIGHSWLVDTASLEIFLDKQKSFKSERARELASSRVKEYRLRHELIERASRDLTKKVSVPSRTGLSVSEIGLTHVSLRSHLLALSSAFAVIIMGANLASAEVLPNLAGRVASIAEEVSSGFNETFGDLPSHLTSKFNAIHEAMQENVSHVATANIVASAQLASPLLSDPDLSSLQMALGENDRTHIAQAPALGGEASKLNAARGITREDVQTFADEAFRFVTSPAQIVSTLAHTYVAIGYNTYALINSSLTSYRSLIEQSGEKMLALAATTRDTLATAPRFVSKMNLALGNAIIDAAHMAIHAEVTLAYSPGVVAPEIARTTVALMSTVGDVLIRSTIATPTIAKMAFLRATEAPAELAPALAEAVFGAEYAGASRFVALTTRVTDRYALALHSLGEAGYTSAVGTRSLANATGSFIAHAPIAIEDAYLGALGKSALALDTITHTSPVAAVLVAASPAFSEGEKIALATYLGIHRVFESMTSALATLFTPSILAVVPTRVTPVATSSPARAPTLVQQTVNSYPTYTTLVQGVSQDFMDQSLLTQRNDILAKVFDMIKPLRDISNLIVRNGSFRGGNFDGGTLTNGISVAATTGNFGSLTAGNTNINGDLNIIGNQTISGSITIGTTTVNGLLFSNGTISGNNFVATSTTATSTFAGSLNIDNGGFVYATSTRNIGIGVLSPAALLAIQNSTSTQPIFVASNAAGAEVYRITNNGFVGIGTTTPGYALAVEGSSSLGNQAIAGYFTATTSIATSTFAGSLAVGTTSPWGNGLFTVGTSTPLLHIDNNSGNVGINGLASNYRLDINGTIRSVGDAFFNANQTTTGSGSFGISVGIAGTATSTGISLLANGAYLIDSAFPLSLNTTHNQNVLFGTGNVGLGIAVPTYTLDVSGNAHFTSYVDASHFVATSTTATSTFMGGFTAGNNAALTINQASPANSLYVTTSGDVGINTSVPLYKLDVNGTFRTVGATFLNANTTIGGTLAQSGLATFESGFLANASSTITTGLFSMNGGASTTQLTTTGSTYLATSGGNVGIGTTNPGEKLDVAGNVRVGNCNYFSGINDIGGTNQIAGICSGITLLGNLGGSQTEVQLMAGGETRMTILPSTGNVGIGTTTPYSRLSVWGANTMSGVKLFELTNSASTTLMSVDNAGNAYLLGNIGIGGTLTQSGLTTFNTGFLANASSTITNGLFSMNGGASTTNITASGIGYFGTSVNAPSFVGALTGNASTATALQNTRAINGVAFNGTADITVPAHAGINEYNLITPTNGTDGTANVPANTATFLNDAGTVFTERAIAENTALVLIDNAANYIVADRDTGTWVVLASADAINYLRYLPYAEIYRSGASLHVQVSPLYGYLQESQNFQRISKTERYARESGFDAISVDASLKITANGGVAWAAFTPFTITAVTPATTWFDSHHVASAWVNTYYAANPVINNTQYDNGTGLVTLTDTYWTINYIYRGIEATEQNHLYRVLGNQQFSSLELAKASNSISSLPDLISSHTMLIGRVIVQKNATSAYTIESAFSTVFAGSSAVTSHASLIGLLLDDHTQYALLAGRAGGQTLMGGTNITDILKLQGTAGIGTATSPAIQALVGTNGGTTAFTILNNGYIGIGTTTPAVTFDIYATDAMRLPVGTTPQRPSGDTGYIRYNTSTHQFEGYGDNSVWQGLGGVINAAQTTYITAGTDDFLRFVTAGAERMTIASNGYIGVGSTTPFARFSLAGASGAAATLFAISTSTAGFATTTALTVNQNGDLSLLNGANLSVAGTGVFDGTISANAGIVSAGPISFTGTNHAGLTINNLTDAQRNALTPASGMTIFNTSVAKMQVYNGATWKNVGNPEIGAEVTAGTAGSVLFVDAGGNLGQDNANFFWDQTNRRLGLGTTTPASALDIANGKSGINIWAATSTLYKKANIGYSDAIVNDVFTISTNAPIGGSYQDIQIVPNGGGSTNNGLYMNTSGQSAFGYTSFADTSIGNALLVNGRVGIGTTTPTSAFSVVANGRATGDLRYGIQIVNSDNANTQATNIGFFGQGGSSGNKWIIGTDVYHNNSNNFFIATSSGPGTVAPLIITSEGALQLGNTTGVAVGNKLYAQNGSLYWDGTMVGSGGFWSNSAGATYGTTLSDKYGFGTTTPFAKFAIHANNGETNTTLFAIASSTASATTTLFSISNTGNLTLSALATPAGTFLAADANGKIIATTSPISSIFANYPLTGLGTSGSHLTLAFGTTTPNTWSGINTFSTLPILGTLSGLVGANNGTLYQVASSSLFGFTPISNVLTKGYFLVGNDAGVAQATSTIFINSVGHVGVGTTTPSANLVINGTTGQSFLQIASSTNQSIFGIDQNGTVSSNAIVPNGPYVTNLASYDLGASATRFNAVWAGAMNVGTSTFSMKSDTASNLGIFTAASGGGVQALTVTSAGGVGIGTGAASLSDAKFKIEVSALSVSDGYDDQTKIASISQATVAGSQVKLTWACGNTITFTYNGGSVTYGTVTGADGKCWMDRNLGATQVAASSADTASYGHLFQWGRGADGHQITNSGTTGTLSSSDTPGNGNFILSPSTPYDWRSPQNDNLWQGVNGVNNVCPTGWRLPTSAEWGTLASTAGITNSATAYSSTLKLPVAGYRYRSDGSLYYLGSYGVYWSSTPSGSSAFNLYFDAGGVNPANANNRAYGFSVRCVKD